jgi:hypothetical protein
MEDYVTPQGSPVRGENMYESKDQHVVIFLLSMGLHISKTTRQGRSGRVTFHFDKKEAMPYIKLWTTGKPVPVSDIRDVFRAYDIFNSAIHDEI